MGCMVVGTTLLSAVLLRADSKALPQHDMTDLDSNNKAQPI